MKRPFNIALPAGTRKLVSLEDELALKAKMFAVRRSLYLKWYNERLAELLAREQHWGYAQPIEGCACQPCELAHSMSQLTEIPRRHRRVRNNGRFTKRDSAVRE